MSLIDILFANRCLHCSLIIDSSFVVCEQCYDQVNFTGWQYGKDNLLYQKLSLLFPVENCYALMFFEQSGLSQKIIHQLKYAGRKKIGKILGEWMGERISFQEKPDLIISVPLHKKKEKKRGYNQLHLFTETLSGIYNVPHDHQYLVRQKFSTAQARKDKSGRLKTGYGFNISKTLKNTHFLLVDDVCTTGNTLSECVWEILKEPTNKVSIVVMAMD